MENKIRTGIIGLGKMGIFHSALVNMIPQAELVSVFDSNQKLSKYVKKTGLNMTFYPDLDRMLEEAKLKAVLICTPPFTHFPLAKKCVAHDLDVFVEKPLAESFSSARKMVSLLDGKGIVHSAGFTIAHIPLFIKAKEALEKNVLGKLFRFNFSVYISQLFSKKKGWLFDKSKSGGGVVIDIASHLIYLILWYFGLPRILYARTVSFYSDVEDGGSVIMEFDEGLSGALDTNWSLPGYRQATMEMTIEGDNGFMEMTNDYIKINLLKPAAGFEKGWTSLYRIDIGSTSHFDLGSEGFFDEDKHFFECCLERKRPKVTWHDGLRVQKIIEAIYRSDEIKRPLSLESVQ